ncbi:PTS sugar transporter subunit IIA [Bifidobacterium bombi]|uniref:PTS system fructose-specific, IIA component n=1 Tax=Bifidobacterium bombi DSM 19703 TaxID=1341695 RepID=A0A086BPG0_9BIFI|nr:PTS sugar transporter subunit IIA [Bifidobacterium bombi]KFF31824.1 PTS system fructose-specific, IIA component [Bifidobacterium bombi DSM 19703]
MAETMDTAALAEVLDPRIIVTGLEAKGKEDVFRDLADRLEAARYVADADSFIDAIHEREQQGATGIGGYVAIPHGRSDTVKRNGVAVAVLKDEIPWESLDDTGAKVVVLFAVGSDDEGSKRHLQLLSLFARRLAKADVVKSLIAATDVDQVKAALLND